MKAPTTPTTMSSRQPRPRPRTSRPAIAPAIRPTMSQERRPPGFSATCIDQRVYSHAQTPRAAHFIFFGEGVLASGHAQTPRAAHFFWFPSPAGEGWEGVLGGCSLSPAWVRHTLRRRVRLTSSGFPPLSGEGWEGVLGGCSLSPAWARHTLRRRGRLTSSGFPPLSGEGW